jgi:hypothetical protein
VKKLAIVLTALLAAAFIFSIIGYVYAQESTPEGVRGAAGCCACASAYAGTDDSNLNIIRQFRDSYLMTNPVGRGVAALYYNVFSPPVAHFIDTHPQVKPLARAALTPVIAASTVAVDTTLPEKIVIISAVALACAALVVLIRRQRTKRAQIS